MNSSPGYSNVSGFLRQKSPREISDTAQILRQVRKVEITTKRLVDGLVAGNYHSFFKGQGIEFSEIREYKAGDDVRAIDWKVTARYNHPFVKEFIEERDLRVYFVFDYSGSGGFGNTIEKRRKAIEMTATLMFSAMRNNDNTGLILFTDQVERFIPARKGRSHVLKLISALVSHQARSKKTSLSTALTFVSGALKRRSVIFIISDFNDKGFEKSLAMLKNRHDIIAIRIGDMRERVIPDVGLIQLEDEESGEQLLVDTSDETVRTRYAALVAEHDTALTSMFKKNKIDTVSMTTQDPYELPLRRFFKTRRLRMR